MDPDDPTQAEIVTTSPDRTMIGIGHLVLGSLFIALGALGLVGVVVWFLVLG